MLDYDRFMNLLFAISLIGLFVVVFNLKTVLAAIRRATYYLTPRENSAARPIRHTTECEGNRDENDFAPNGPSVRQRCAVTSSKTCCEVRLNSSDAPIATS